MFLNTEDAIFIAHLQRSYIQYYKGDYNGRQPAIQHSTGTKHLTALLCKTHKFTVPGAVLYRTSRTNRSKGPLKYRKILHVDRKSFCKYYKANEQISGKRKY